MDLYFWESSEGNFGDDINPWIWPKLLPVDLFREEAPEWLFVGIGSLLNESLPASPRKVIFSTGAGYFERPPEPDETWFTYAVRGPLTAEILGLPPEAAVTDGAALIAAMELEKPDTEYEASFVPHHRNAQDGASAWRRVCQRAGVNYVDPRAGVEDVLASLAGSGVVITEAMHGAIAADALRRPWIPVRSRGIHAFKWKDWCRSLEMEYEPRWLPTLYDRPREEPTARRIYRSGKEKLAELRISHLVGHGRRRLSERSVLEDRVLELRHRLDQLSEDLRSGKPRRRGWGSS